MLAVALLAPKAAAIDIDVPEDAVESFKSKCTGSGDPPQGSNIHYQGTAGALGIKESVSVTLKSYSGGKGVADVAGSGALGFNCKSKPFTKSGQTIDLDISDCAPSGVSLKKTLYCSDQDLVSVDVGYHGVTVHGDLKRAGATFDDVLSRFTEWKAEFGKFYETALDEANALMNFAEADRRITEHNKQELSYTMGHTLMSDGVSFVPGLHVDSDRVLDIEPQLLLDMANASAFASSLDWQAKGKVTSVEQQGSCGCCWAFSAAGAIESRRAIAGHGLTKLSKEELINCDMNANGCAGARSIDEGLKFAKNNGLDTETAYPYTSARSPESSGHDGQCQTSKEKSPTAKVGGVKDVPRRNANALMAALQNGPVSVGIFASPGSPLQNYHGGVIHGSCSTTNNHAVLAVGYGHDSATGLDYWKVKNSWGSSFGERGYFRIQRGQNVCGIEENAAYPTQVS